MWDDNTLQFLEQAYLQNRRKQEQQQQVQPQRGGGFIGNLVNSIVTPSARFINQAGNELGTLIDTGKMQVAARTDNREAFRNAEQQASDRFANFKDTGGFLNKGTITNEAETRGGYAVPGIKKIGGTTAEVASLLVPAGKAGIVGQAAKGALAGSLYGGGEALSQDKSLEDALTSSLTGAAVGGAVGGAFGVGGKVASKIGSRFGNKAEEAATRGLTDRTGNSLLGDAWGIKSGSKIGSKVVTPQEANNLQRFVIDKIGVPKTASADMVFERAVNFSNDTGNAISTAIKTSGKKLGANDVNGIASSLEGKFSKVLGGDYTNNQTAQSILSRVKSAKTPNELWSLAKEIDDELINFNRNPAGGDPIVERFAQIARDDVRGALNKAIPELKNLNSAYGQAKQVEQLVAKSANNPRGLNIFGNKVGGSLAQRGKSAIGQLTDNVPSISGAGSGIGAKIPSFVNAQNAGIARNALTTGLTESQLNPQSQGGQTSLEDALMQAGNDQGAGFGQSLQQDQQDLSPYSRDNLMADIQRDPKNADKYISMFESLQKLYAPSQDSLQLSDSAIKNVNDLQGALFDINSLGEKISRSNVSGPISGYRALNPFDSEAKSLQAEIDRVRQVVGKALEGGVLRKEDEVKYAKILPTIKDTKEVANNKLKQLQIKLSQDLNNYVGLQQQTGKGRSNTLSDALLMQQGAY